ncbi:MAG: hypothetical protein ACOCY7_04285 [Halodesulfurarchaeum sp.]
MSVWTRSSLLLAGGVGLSSLSGCAYFLDEGSSSETRERRDRVMSGMYFVNRNTHRARDFSIVENWIFEYSFTVVIGPAIDVFLMTDSEYDRYDSDERFRYIEDASVLDSGSSWAETLIPPGDYVFVLDNTDSGEAKPSTGFGDLARVGMAAYLTSP